MRSDLIASHRAVAYDEEVVDFEQVLKALLQAFARHRIRYAVIGGFAIGVLGPSRATADVDLLVHREDLDPLDRIMSALGYKRLARTENVSHYAHPETPWGAVDFVHAFRTPSLTMLERAVSLPIFNGTQQIRVAQPEDVIGLKVQAMANNPLRNAKERADIEALMEIHGVRLDWARVQEYFDLFEMGEEGRRLKERFSHAE